MNTTKSTKSTKPAWKSVQLLAYDDCGERSLKEEDTYNWIGAIIAGGKSMILQQTVNQNKVRLGVENNAYTLTKVEGKDYFRVVAGRFIICVRICGLTAQVHYTYIK